MYTATELGEQVGLSTTPCWRRVQRLEQAGYIRQRVALLDHDRMNVGVTVFVAVRTSRHSRDWLESFRRAVATIPEIVEAHQAGKRALLEEVERTTGIVFAPDRFTVGFARRATAYKRGDMLFRDIARLNRIAEEAGPRPRRA